jgi:hypothetical protein
VRRASSRNAVSIVLGTVAVSTLVAGVTPAIAATPSPAAISLTAVGDTPRVPNNATPASPLALNQQVSFDVVLKPRNPAALNSFVQAVSTPGSPQYHQFLAPGQYASTFGPTQQTVANVTAEMKALGLTVGSLTGSVLPVSGPATTVASAFHTSFKQYKLASGRIARANTSAPELPATVAASITGVVGLETITQRTHAPIKPNAIANTTTPHQTCLPAGSAYFGYYNADQLATYYGFNSYYGGGHYGDGVRVALFELEPFDPSDIAMYQSCYGTSSTINTIAPNGVSAGTGSEAELDIEDVIGLAPGATIDVYEDQNDDAGFMSELINIADTDTAPVVSISWGLCEAGTGTSQMNAERSVFQQMAAQGQSVFAASGDSGSEACSQADPTDDDLGVGDPASQPEVTGVGGTSLTGLTAGSESVWNDSADYQGAGGGGISSQWTMPSWQAGAGLNADSSGTPCGAAIGQYCREVPDVSASADPELGYPIYFNDPVDGPDWYGFGGTSAAAPTWASFIALVDSACPGGRVGFINPALYQLGSDFNDITVGNNDYTADNGGSYPARAGYDLASGLGSPRAAALGAALCSSPASIGTGTMAVDNTSVHTSTATTLTFTYTMPAGKGLDDGEVDVFVPSGWTAPSLTSSVAGYTTSNLGQLSVATVTGGWKIKAQGITALSGNTVTITYGDTSGGALGSTAPSTAQSDTFTTSVRSTASAPLAALSSQPAVVVWTNATAGQGTMTVAPSTVLAGSTDALVFTYKAAPNTKLANGTVDLAIPADWTPPQLSAGAGYVQASTGTAALSPPDTVEVTNVTLDLGQSLTITYGAGTTATAPGTPETSSFAASQGGTALSSPATVNVLPNAADGTGTMTISPTRVSPSSTSTLTFTYTAPSTGFITNGELTIDVPAEWSAPSTINTNPGYVTATGVSINITGGTTIAVTGINLAPNATLTITYANAVAPATPTTSTFPTSEMSTSSGTLTPLSLDPSIQVALPPPPPSGGGGGGGGNPSLLRVSGADRIATSIAASQTAFPKADSARVVVLARYDSFADALAGTPLAAKEVGPLLLTVTSSLTTDTTTEISRVLPVGATIYLLGGNSAISPTVQTTLVTMGYVVQRLAGADRYATAVAIAGALGNPTTVFEADGSNFPDALSAGSAAAQQGGAILLTAGSTMPSASSGYLAAHPSVRYAIGGPAAKADKGATPLVGSDRFATSLLVATTFFTSPAAVALASGINFPDALSGGAVASLSNGPMLLVPNVGTIPATTISYLASAGASASSAWLFGGTASVSDDVFSQAARALKPVAIVTGGL